VANKVLVAYASKYGATAAIAEKIGEVLRQADLQVDVVPVKSVTDPAQYHAFVLGSAAYMDRWRKEVVSFLKKRQELLAEKPTWIFSSGPLGEGDPVELLKGERFPKSLQPVIDRIKPREVAVFHGFVDLEKLNAFEKFVFTKVTDMRGDFRDWDAITSWAESIAGALKK
jgi:menaquinone-dependent protoporphyrinogen oxidase